MPKQSFKQKALLSSAVVLLLVILILARADFSIEPMQAASADNVFGWAWSENIGWISFNSTNCDTDDDDGFSDGGLGCPLAGVFMEKYGVDVDEGTGLFSGYAWSENIGWISFDPGSVAGCPGGACQAQVNRITGAITGWARACAVFPDGVCSGALRPNDQRGNWEGWISLSCDNTVSCGTSDYKVSYNNSTDEFSGWAWAGGTASNDEASVGWISFNKLNCDGGALPGCPAGPLPDYKVEIIWGDPPMAQANCQCPVGASDCDDLTCTAYLPNHINNGGIFLNANGSCDLQDCSCSDGGFPSAVPCDITCDWSSLAWTSTGCGNNLFAPASTGSYDIDLMVTDLDSRDDTDIITVNLTRDVWADFECCYGEDKNLEADCDGDWQACSGIKLEIARDKIWLRADPASRPSEGASLDETSYTWTFFPLETTVPADSTGSIVGWFYVTVPQANISLQITDSLGRSDIVIKTLDAEFPMPGWHEI